MQKVRHISSHHFTVPCIYIRSFSKNYHFDLYLTINDWLSLEKIETWQTHDIDLITFNNKIIVFSFHSC